MAKLPIHMSVDEIVAEIKRAHDDIEHTAFRMGELCRLLLLRSRATSLRTAMEAQVTSRPNPRNPSGRTPTQGRSDAEAGDGTAKIATSMVVFANAWLRLSGLVVQAVRRTRVADRSLDADKRDVEAATRASKEKVEREARKEARTERQERRSRTGSSIGDLMELYGKEIVEDAR